MSCSTIKTLNMLPLIFKQSNFIRFGLLTTVGITLTACSSLNQKPYDVDGIYNNSKIVVEDTYEKGAYYTEYFKESTAENEEIFTDIDNYASNYEEGNAGWGDVTSETQLVYDFGWGHPMGGFYNSYWGYGYGMGGFWGAPYYGMGMGWGSLYYGMGWGYPYYGYGWGYPYYGWGSSYYGNRTLSRSNTHRALNNRNLALGNNSNRRMVTGNGLRNSNAITSRNFNRTDRTFSRTSSNISRMQAADRSQAIQTGRTRVDNFNNNSRSNRLDNNSRTNRIDNSTRTNRVNTRQIDRTSRPTYTPSSNTRMNSGGSFGGSRGGSMGGGMRSGGGGRR